METLVQLLLTLTLAGVLALFFSFLRRRTPAGNPIVPIVEVTDAAFARHILINRADAFSSRAMAPFPVDLSCVPRRAYTIETVPFGPLWRVLRSNLTANALHASRHGILAPLRCEAVGALVASLTAHKGDDEVVLRDSLHNALFMLVARLCFGEGVDARDVRSMERELQDFFKNFNEFLALQQSRIRRLLHWQRWQQLTGSLDRVSKLLLPQIVARRQRSSSSNNGGPYVDTLIDLHVPDFDGQHDGHALTDEEIVALVWEFLGSSTESAVSCAEWALAHLINEPEVQNKLYHEVASDQWNGVISDEGLRGLPYLHAIVLETLRLHPPVPITEREVVASEAAKVADGMSPPILASDSTHVRFRINLAEMGRDPKAWKDPDEFRPERFLAGGDTEGASFLRGPNETKMMPFGAGRRVCPAAEQGVMHTKMFLATLVREFEWVLPADGGNIDLAEYDEFFKVMKTPLRARIKPRALLVSTK